MPCGCLGKPVIPTISTKVNTYKHYRDGVDPHNPFVAKNTISTQNLELPKVSETESTSMPILRKIMTMKVTKEVGPGIGMWTDMTAKTRTQT